MSEMKYLFGPVPSRRMGMSLGISPIPKKSCNYSCVYCQLGRTRKPTNVREEYFPLQDILDEFDAHIDASEGCDVITLVGDGEPTLYSRMGDLIDALHQRTEIPIAVITNGALMYDPEVRAELMKADIVLPSVDACNEKMFRRIDRPLGSIKFDAVTEGLRTFSEEYQGSLYLEIMLLDGLNDTEEHLQAFKELLSTLKYDRVYLNTAVRPPAEAHINASSKEAMARAVEVLNGISIEMLAEGGFSSDIEDDYEAILSIIARHPMNQHEIKVLLDGRGHANLEDMLQRLQDDPQVDCQSYKGYITYRLH